jgi:hypothetical protein
MKEPRRRCLFARIVSSSWSHSSCHRVSGLLPAWLLGATPRTMNVGVLEYSYDAGSQIAQP